MIEYDDIDKLININTIYTIIDIFDNILMYYEGEIIETVLFI